MHSVICLTFRDLSLVTILRVSWNRCMSFISGIEWTALKMVYIRLMIYLRKHTKFFRYITVYGGKYIKIILLHLDCIEYNVTNSCLLHLQNHTYYKEKGMDSINILYTVSYKRIPNYYGQQGKTLKLHFFIMLVMNKIKWCKHKLFRCAIMYLV